MSSVLRHRCGAASSFFDFESAMVWLIIGVTYMRVGYSEFSFGYAFTENIIRAAYTGPRGAPIFPNLVQEARLGFDVQINFPGVPLFFQYKLPELMRRSTASEISTFNCPGLSVPFFRMPLMRRDLSRQHQLLIELENRYPGAVHYASPCLTDIEEFDRAYNLANVHRRSIFFSPNEIGPLPDDRSHTISYKDGLQVAYLRSEPREIRTRTFEILQEEIRYLFDREAFRSLRVASRNVLENVRSLVSPAMRIAEESISERIDSRRMAQPDVGERSLEDNEVIKDILVAREMARVDIGVDLMIAQPRP